jgi:tetratricopeptide (TPR) repeat protein
MLGRLAHAVLGLALVIAATKAAPAQSAAEADRLNADVTRLYREGRYAEATPLAQRALAIRETVLGSEHPDFTTSLNNLAELYRLQGRYVEAEVLHTRSLTIREKVLGPEHPWVAETLGNLAYLNETQGRYPQAEALYKRSLALGEKARGPEHPEVGRTLNNLAGLLQINGRYAEAEPHYKRSIAIREKALGPNHPDVANSLSNLAELQRRRGRYGEAEALQTRSLAIREKVLGPAHPDVGRSLNNLAVLYRAQGRNAEADPLFKRSLAIREKALGPDHPDVAETLGNLSGTYQALGNYADALPLIRRSLAIWEKARGPEHPEVATSLANLAGLLQVLGTYAEAEPLYMRSLAIREKLLGPAHPDVGHSLNNLGVLYRAQGRIAEAEPMFKRSLDTREKALGPDHPDVANSLQSLATIYVEQGRFSDAELLYKRSISIQEKALGLQHPDVAKSLASLAGLYSTLARYAEAEPLYKRCISIYEQALGPEHADVATSLYNLASLYRRVGRTSEAKSLYERSLTVWEKALGLEHPLVATSLHNLAELYRTQRRTAEANQLFKRSLAIREKALGLEHIDVAASLNNIALLHQDSGRFAEAEALLTRSLTVLEKAFGPEHLLVARSRNNLAVLFEAQGRTAEAEQFHKSSLATLEKALGTEHPEVAVSHNNMAWLAIGQGDWSAAANHWRRASALLRHRAEHGQSEVTAETSQSETQRKNSYFNGLVKVTYRLGMEGRLNAVQAASEMFETAQLGQGSSAASALAQMAARTAGGSRELAVLVRERQDLVGERQLKDNQFIAARSEPPGNRNASAEKALGARLDAIDIRLAAIDARLAKDFADYAALARPKPVSVAEAQAALRADEALVLFLDTDSRFKPLPDETFVWVVTKSDVRWLRSGLGTAALRREVAALRCGLDAAAWHDAGKATCARLMKLPLDKAPQHGAPLPFDVTRSHALYKSLLGGAEDLIKGKQLLVVPSGALTTLPLQVLVTEAPKSQDIAAARWLIRDHALTVLPSVAALGSLRRTGKPSAAQKPMIGFANPLLDGDQGHSLYGSYYKQQADRARAQTSCAEAAEKRTTELRGVLRSLDAGTLVGGSFADLNHLRVQAPLPETADEVCDVARAVGADVAEMRIGARANEGEIKRLSNVGELAKYRILHFATHGTLAGQLSGTSEPGLILTPPKAATADDDGYLSGSEIAGLKLDADWVILSACNTAGGSGQGDAAEALSGLARVFFYAGARALLVSHWEVDSDAAVKLVTGAIGALAQDQTIGRAEAMRRAVLAAMADTTRPSTWIPASQPSVWAPFVVVGEGGVGQ